MPKNDKDKRVRIIVTVVDIHYERARVFAHVSIRVAMQSEEFAAVIELHYKCMYTT